MDKEVKELQSEDVRYKARIAAGAWLCGETLKEKSKATDSKCMSFVFSENNYLLFEQNLLIAPAQVAVLQSDHFVL